MRWCLWLLLLIPFPAWAQGNRADVPVQLNLGAGPLQVYLNNLDLLFPDIVLDGTDRLAVAISGPTITVMDASGSGSGWRVLLQSSDFLGAGQTSIPAANFGYRAQGGSLSRLEGLEIDLRGPRETGVAGPLHSPLLALVSPARSGMGTYQWRPAPGSFQLAIPAQTLAGTYRAVVTVTLVRGYP